jgi:hypothetical protein
MEVCNIFDRELSVAVGMKSLRKNCQRPGGLLRVSIYVLGSVQY